MAAVVFNHILRVLCNNQCSLEFQHLERILGQTLTVDQQLLRRVLMESDNFRVVDEDSAKRALSPGAVIIATTPLRVCKEQAKCARCKELHLCRYLVCGKCRFG